MCLSMCRLQSADLPIHLMAKIRCLVGQVVTFEPCDQYQLMVEDFVYAVDEGRCTDSSQSYHLTRLLSEMVQSPMTVRMNKCI